MTLGENIQCKGLAVQKKRRGRGLAGNLVVAASKIEVLFSSQVYVPDLLAPSKLRALRARLRDSFKFAFVYRFHYSRIHGPLPRTFSADSLSRRGSAEGVVQSFLLYSSKIRSYLNLCLNSRSPVLPCAETEVRCLVL